ncbi:MAG: AMP-binding protein [Alcanivorax sp.]|nr:AMP-binding protein [Alcanivorax sp.]
MAVEHRPWLAAYDALGHDWHQLPTLPEKTLSDYIRDHARHHGDREALVFLGQSIRYAELDQLADRLASLLVALGCQPGEVLGVQLPNTPQYVVALVAAARLGMVCTSLSPLMKPVELGHQLQDAGVKVMLTLAPFWDTVVQPALAGCDSLEAVLLSSPTELTGTPLPDRDEQAGAVRLLSLWSHLGDGPLPPVSVSLDDVLYLQYTGGTTGLPKGARLTSRNLLINNMQANLFYGLRDGEETVASAFPLFHIGGAAVLFNALRTASTFLLIPDPRDLDHFVAEMSQRPATVLAAVPALYQGLCSHAGFRELDFARLRVAVSGGAPFAVSEIQRLEALIGPDKFYEVYGMTETSPVLTINPAGRLKPGWVGIPLPGTEVRIVDAERGVPLPAGEAGEIIASGPQVMRGYLARPDATAGALREHDGRTWMYTGDVGVMDEDGYIRVCDRSKDMLIVGGYKVFSVEVENRVQALPWVALCAVVGCPDPRRPGNDVVQLYVQHNDTELGSDAARRQALLDFCRDNLSPYKVPREIVFVDAIPLTSVGKLDKKALRATAAAEAG